jgi:uncharacterized protein (DUF983 family)
VASADRRKKKINCKGVIMDTNSTSENIPTPGYLQSLFTMKCPRCRRGEMFIGKNPYKKLSLKYIFDMPEQCAECGQKFDMEPGFWYGTGFVSYGLAVFISILTFILWLVLIGVSVKEGDHRIFWWLGVNAFILLIIQPWLMRFSRALYIRFFVNYDKDYKNTKPTKYG